MIEYDDKKIKEIEEWVAKTFRENLKDLVGRSATSETLRLIEDRILTTLKDLENQGVLPVVSAHVTLDHDDPTVLRMVLDVPPHMVFEIKFD